VVLEICGGDSGLPGGRSNLNQLAAKAVDALADSANCVIALATKDVQVATVLMAIAPADTPTIWTGETKGVAKRLRMSASVHGDFRNGLYVAKKELVSTDDDDEYENEEKVVLVIPAKLLHGDDDDSEEEIDAENSRTP